MNITESRKQISDLVLEGRFIRKVLGEASKDIDQAQRKYMSSRGFENNDWYNARGFSVSDTTMDYTHLKKHRFVDMKYRNTKKGKVKRKAHPIHNKIIYGHYNNIVKELHFGFVESVKQEMRKMGD